MFTLLDSALTLPQAGISQVYLVKDNWDDWFKFRTMFTLFVFDQNGARHRVGSLKIGEAGLQGASTATPGFRAPHLPATFPWLDPNRHFSLGQDEDFYSTLYTFSANLCESILKGLCDCAFNLGIFARHLKEPVMQESLLRSVREESVRNRLHRMANGNAALTRFQFKYTLPEPPVKDGQHLSVPPPTLTFHVEPNSHPPTNVHVLVGRNGAGKTRCIQTLINAVLGRQSEFSPPGILQRLGDNQDEWAFTGLVSVSFSAFDEFEAPPPATEIKLRAGFVGLRNTELVDGQARNSLKTKDDLARDFVKSFAICREEPRRSRWVKAVQTLATDPLFAEVDIERFLLVDGEDWEVSVAHAFKKLSSGHSIVLLTTTRLVELVDESTLVVLDEPEGHLHPPLLAAFVRAVSDLLVSRNGVALISTHSPVVLQEVPMNCVWMLRRSRTVAVVERPPTETFGESAGVLTRAVFGLEVSNSGFHKMVASVANEPGRRFEEVTSRFGGALGSEARVLARSIIAQRPN
ncbi:AAA family ATPase [Limnohabitans sp.]|uniref:AAA family ATPase n=1 Tax=Limnohabitans sp. TaxID=1907725 RepID=UPI0025BF53FB|nr:AAA family ATPase [Limnohabitans sp.]